jgi:hypothetical protein
MLQKRLFYRTVLSVAAVSVTGAACADGPAEPGIQERLVIEPSSVVADGLEREVEFSALWVDGAGVSRPAESAAWESTDPEVATIMDGRARTRSHGLTGILARVGGEEALAVLEVVPAVDSLPPTLTRFLFTPSQVDVTSSNTRVNLNASVVDSLSGTHTAIAMFRSTGVGNTSTFATLRLTSGTRQDGRWSGHIIVPAGTPAGIWRLMLVRLEDAAGNVADYLTEDLQRLGIRTDLVVQSGG